MKIWLSRPHMGGREQHHVGRAFANNFIAPAGPQLEEFEKELTDYLGENTYCLAVSSGTAALHLALHMLELDQEDEVWVSSMTFAGGAFPILYERAKPVFFDLSAYSWTLDPNLVEEELIRRSRAGEKLPRAIIPADLYGQSCDLHALESIAAFYEIPLIVDSAESLGASYAGRKAGAGGTAAVLSFNGNKIITTGGGGALVSRDSGLIDRARFLSTQAREPAPHYQHSVYGYNYRLSNVSAAIGLGQLEMLDVRVRQRRKVFDRYVAGLSDMPGLAFMPEPDSSYSTRWLTALTVDSSEAGVTREDIRLELLEHGIESRPLWKPMHLQPLFKGARYIGRGLDEGLFNAGLCLPSGSDLTIAEQDEVILRVAKLFGA